MGAINWIPKWFHGNAVTARDVVAEFPRILTRGLRPAGEGQSITT
jgi:hypothetical protein